VGYMIEFKYYVI